MRHIVETNTRPTTAEMDEHVRDLADDPKYRIVRESPWKEDGKYKKWLVSQKPDGSHTATLVIAEYADGLISYLLIDEADGIFETDIPKQLFQLIEDSPPTTQDARDWRERVKAQTRSSTGRVSPNAFANMQIPSPPRQR